MVGASQRHGGEAALGEGAGPARHGARGGAGDADGDEAGGDEEGDSELSDYG